MFKIKAADHHEAHILCHILVFIYDEYFSRKLMKSNLNFKSHIAPIPSEN
jgi:hypothetical protein